MDVLTWTEQHFKNWHVFHIENPQACEGLVEKATTLAFSHESSMLQKSRGPDYVSPGWGVNTTGDGYTEIHSLYKGTAGEPSEPGIGTRRGPPACPRWRRAG